MSSVLFMGIRAERSRVLCLLFGILGTMLGGCATNAEIAQDTCARAGYARGTNAYASCYVTVVERERRRGEALLGIGLGAMSGSGSGSGAGAPTGFRTYQIDGRIYTCSTAGTVTTCR